MRTKHFFRSAMLTMGLFILQNGHAQVSVELNSPTTPGTDYVGWDNTTTVPLMIRHDKDQPIDIYTEMLRRITVLPDASYTIGAFTTQVKDGAMLLCPDVDQFYANGAPGPYTTLHLAAADDNAQEAGYRPNMGNGITMTGNDDQMYVGQLFNGLDYTDAAIVWSDKQRLRQPRYYA